MSDDMAYQQALKKGERFFARKNFLLAKKEFERALQFQASEELLEKIRICSREIALHERSQTIKKGRRFDKQGKSRQALACFEQAFAQREEDWLARKITALREKLSFKARRIAVEDTEVNQQAALEQRILCYLFAGEYATTRINFNLINTLTAITSKL